MQNQKSKYNEKWKQDLVNNKTKGWGYTKKCKNKINKLFVEGWKQIKNATKNIFKKIN